MDVELVILWVILLTLCAIVAWLAAREWFRAIGRWLANIFFGRVPGGRK